MPRPDHAWFHVMWHTYGTWLPGDPRGFRDRHHRIHSSGDYKNPPPAGEHAGLHRYAKRVSQREVVLATPPLRRAVCDVLLETATELDLRVMALTVCRVHVHVVLELPADRDAFDGAMTKLKTKSSARVANKPASRLWGRRWKSAWIETPEHRRIGPVYVRDRQGRAVCAWTSRDGFVRNG